MQNVNRVKIIILQDKEKIYKAISTLANSLFDQTINTVPTLQKLSNKFSNYATVLVAEIDEEIVGFCSFYDNDTISLTAFLSMIVVKNGFQGHGIGNILMQTMINNCRNKNMKRIRLEVDNNNNNAILFYKKRGFELEDQNSKSSFYSMDLKKHEGDVI